MEILFALLHSKLHFGRAPIFIDRQTAGQFNFDVSKLPFYFECNVFEYCNISSSMVGFGKQSSLLQQEVFNTSHLLTNNDHMLSCTP